MRRFIYRGNQSVNSVNTSDSGSDLSRQATHLRADGEAGMTTAEYAIGTIAAAAFAGVLIAVVRSGGIAAALSAIIERALNV